VVGTNVILLIEDNPDDEALTLRAFRNHNIANAVDVARDGEEALTYLLGSVSDSAGARDLPQVVLLDLQLPKISGLDVLRRLRAEARTQYLPIVILTSSNEERDLVEGYRFGANSYVRKPVDFIQFAEAIRILGLYWLVLNEPFPQHQDRPASGN
jgi:two-component system response regulator